MAKIISVLVLFNLFSSYMITSLHCQVPPCLDIKADELETGIYIYSLTADQKTIDTKTFIITE